MEEKGILLKKGAGTHGCSCSGMERAVVRKAESGVSEMEVTVTCSVERDCRGCRKVRTSVHSRSFPGAEPERQNCKDCR